MARNGKFKFDGDSSQISGVRPHAAAGSSNTGHCHESR